MIRRLMTSITVLILLLIAVPGIASTSSLREFLSPVDAFQQKKALQRIINDKERNSGKIKDLLESYYSEKQIDKNLNDILYLTAILKDPNHLDILKKMLVDDNYLIGQCNYDCPIVLTMTVYALTTDWKPPSNLKAGNTKVNDLLSNLRYWPDAVLKKDHAYKHISGTKAEKLLKAMSTLSEKELIEMAGSNNPDSLKRLFAAYELSYSVTTAQNLIDLYMLAINEMSPDGTLEYRNSIYTAILRAEISKGRQQSGSPQ